MLPPGDLRMALAALCGDDDWGDTWARVLQHRFAGDGEMRGHVVGNLLIVGLWELLGDHVDALDWVGRLLGAKGRVLPMALTPMDITAEVRGARPADPDALTTCAARSRSPPPTASSPRSPWSRPTRRSAPRPLAAIARGRLGRARARARGSPRSSRTCWCPRCARRWSPPTPGVVVVLNLAEQAGETRGFGPGRPPRRAARARPRPARPHRAGRPARPSTTRARRAARGGRGRRAPARRSTTSRRRRQPRATTRRSWPRPTPGSSREPGTRSRGRTWSRVRGLLTRVGGSAPWR